MLSPPAATSRGDVNNDSTTKMIGALLRLAVRK
jgi:hypothetical protein